MRAEYETDEMTKVIAKCATTGSEARFGLVYRSFWANSRSQDATPSSPGPLEPHQTDGPLFMAPKQMCREGRTSAAQDAKRLSVLDSPFRQVAPVSPLPGIRRSLLRPVRAMTARLGHRSEAATCTGVLRRKPRIRVLFSRLGAHRL